MKNYQRCGAVIPVLAMLISAESFAMGKKPVAVDPPARDFRIINVYQGKGTRNHSVGKVEVNVLENVTPLVLVLSAYEPVNWELEGASAAKVRKVVLNGYYKQTVSSRKQGVVFCHSASCPAGTIQVESHSYQANGKALFPQSPGQIANYSYSFYNVVGSPAALEFEQLMRNRLGLPSAGYDDAYEGTQFTVSGVYQVSPGAEDRDLRARMGAASQTRSLLEWAYKYWNTEASIRATGAVKKPARSEGYVFDEVTSLPYADYKGLISELYSYERFLGMGKTRGVFIGQFVRDESRRCKSSPTKVCAAGDMNHTGGFSLILKKKAACKAQQLSLTFASNQGYGLENYTCAGPMPAVAAGTKGVWGAPASSGNMTGDSCRYGNVQGAHNHVLTSKSAGTCHHYCTLIADCSADGTWTNIRYTW